ncbi:hypothetical protein pdam_00016308 [Pocillopora damicornis]|uniref:AAA+ ATPase domain-containing protein n=1 Tax=Pocillopora damicornis TaxID=46731 RepID=A0A3M6U443_POCDA|nr:hypothetical protein pdam_00016308 [Pocillopora damicornis]
MSMEEWEIPYEEDDFESRYADELDMLEELDEEVVAPSSKKGLNFHNVKEAVYKEVDVDTPCKKKARLSPSKYGGSHEADYHLPNIRSPLRELQPSLDQSQFVATMDRRLNEIASTKAERRKVFRRPPMSCESVSITRTDGQRLYLSIRHEREEKSDGLESKGLKKKLFRRGTGNLLQLLSVPFSVLRESVEEERRRRTIEESEKLTESLQRMLDDGNSNIEEVELKEPSRHDNHHSIPQHSLWVEKYTPRFFTELLSDDAINRTLLKWLKLWDKTVFGKGQDKKVKVKADQATKQKTFNSTKNNKKQQFTGIQDEADWNQVDASGRPVHKVALLCGPPGLGKTTLSHVIARHAGYNVVEMNASDDRSPEIFRNTLEASTQMKSVLGGNEKPNCLVIDEIDGAPAPAINVLLSVVKQKNSDTDPSQKGRKKKKSGPLSRPIICICNDQYAPALRQLRQVAFVVTFPPTIPSRLATRLLEISRQESVNTDMTTLTSLCEKTDNDIRSCLNTLQFIQKRHGQVGIQHVQATDIGLKDSHRSLFSIWQEIFQLPKPKRRRFADIADIENHKNLADNRGMPLGGFQGNMSSVGEQRGMTSLASRFHTVLHSAMSNGQYDKVTQGLFENYLQVKFKDPSFEVVVCGTEWLEFSDFIEQAVIGRQSYILQGYSPFISVAFHLFCTSQSHSKLSYPSSQYESHLKETKTKNLVNAIKNESSPHIRKNISLRIACLDLLPFMLEVITPTLRPKKQLAELIDTMIAYNVTFHQERNFDGQYTYVLDPNVEEAVKFPGLPRHRQLTYAIKQLIAREIELEKMRRAERAFKSRADERYSPPINTSDSKKLEQEKLKKPVVVLSLDTSKAKPLETKPVLDFFGRPVKVKPKDTGDKTSSQSARSQPSLIWFRFNEGYSNAVRKSVKVLEFL